MNRGALGASLGFGAGLVFGVHGKVVEEVWLCVGSTRSSWRWSPPSKLTSMEALQSNPKPQTTVGVVVELFVRLHACIGKRTAPKCLPARKSALEGFVGGLGP